VDKLSQVVSKPSHYLPCDIALTGGLADAVAFTRIEQQFGVDPEVFQRTPKLIVPLERCWTDAAAPPGSRLRQFVYK